MKSRIRLLISRGALVVRVFLLMDISVASASDETTYLEFDNRMLWGAPSEKAVADLSRFSKGNPVPSGNVRVHLYLNGSFLNITNVYFKPVQSKKTAAACFTSGQLKSNGLVFQKLSEEAMEWMRDDKGASGCKFISDVVPGSNAAFDFNEQKLELSIPQAYLQDQALDYISPELWDRGITAGRLNYTADVFDFRSTQESNTQGFVYLESGFNAGGWRLRNISSAAFSGETTSFQAQRSYAQTDVEPLKSTLTLGQNYTDGQLFNSYGLQGAFMATDIRMLPSSLRNYAPVVSGVADTNAKVTISQNNVVIYERAVPPGPFEISNLNAVGYGNDLEVTVTEADGSSKKFSVPYSPLVQLLRPGQSKYSASVGEAWLPTHGRYKPMVGQFNYQSGVNNYLTAFGGALVSEDYVALALGGAISTYVGGISVDFTHSNNHSDLTGSARGDSLRFIYSTLIKPTNTNITLSSYRYSSRDFWSFNEFLMSENTHFQRGWNDPDFYSPYGAKQKGKFDVSLRQRLFPGYGSFSLNGSTRNYWNKDGSDTQYRFSYSNRFKDLTYDLSMSRVKDQYDYQYSEFRLSFSLPLFSSDYARNYLSTSAWKHSDSGSVAQLQFGGITGADQQITYGVSSMQGLDNQNPQKSYGLNGGYQGSKGYLSGGISTGNGYQQSSLGVSGSLLAHSGGLTLGQTLGETIALVEAKDGKGARITNVNGALLDSSGFGVVPYLSPYSRNRIELDPEGLSADLQFKGTSLEAIPVDGSIVKVNFETSKERSLLINGVFDNGEPLPFGAEVVSGPMQRLVGYVGQAGSVFVRGIEQQGELEVKLEKRSCFMEYRAEGKDSEVEGSGIINGVDAVCMFK